MCQKKLLKKGLPFFICLSTTLGLGVAGFCVPPTGVIDGSVLKFASLLFGFATIDRIPDIIEVVGSIKVTHGDTIIEANKDDDGND